MEFPSTVPDLNQLPDLNGLSALPNANVGEPNTGTSSDTIPNRSDEKVAMATSSLADDKESRPRNKNFHTTCSKRKVSTSAEAGDMTMPRASKRISQPTRKAPFNPNARANHVTEIGYRLPSIPMQEPIF